MTELLMSGHDRSYLPPRSLRKMTAELEDPLSALISAGKVTAWDLLTVDGHHPASQWAQNTLDSILAAGRTDALGCTDCEDTGFYGLTASGDDDLLVGMLRRVGDGEYESLQADGLWQTYTEDTGTAEVLSLEIAEDLADAITAGASGLLRKYCWPLAFLPPASVTAAAPLAETAIETGHYAVVDDDDPGAVMMMIRVDEDAMQSFQAGAWEPWEAPDANLMAIPLDDDALACCQEQMVAAGALVADAPLTVSPNPKAEKLRRYWSSGKGAAKIKWGTPSDWRRCYRHLKKYMGLRARGYCQNLHRRNTGMWTGDRRNRGFSGSVAVDSPVCLSSGVVLRLGDRFEMEGLKAGPYTAQVVDGEALRNWANPDLVSEAMHVVVAAGSDSKDSVAVVLERTSPDPVKTELSSPRAANLAEVQESLLQGSAVGSKDSVFLVSAILTPTVKEVLRAKTSLPNVLVASISAALRDESGRTHWPAAERIAILLPTSIVSLAKSSTHYGSTRALVDHTARHEINNTLLASVDAQVAAAIASGQWTGETERNSDMAETIIAAGVYCEVDDSDSGLLRTLVAGGFPVAPPDEWYANPEFTGPTPMEIDDDGRVRGHIATFDVTHIGMAGAVHAPKNKSGYAYFLTGSIKTASGKSVNVGPLTLAGGHAPLHADAGSAVKHYDDTNSGVADVTVGEDAFGIWAAGSLRPSVTPEQIRVFRASPLSGDWRPINGNLELVAACAVNVPGFPIARAQVASGGAVLALVAAGARPLAVRRASMTADAALLERITALEARIPAQAEIGEVIQVEPKEVSTPEPESVKVSVGDQEVTEPVVTEAAMPVVEVTAAEPEPAIPATVETLPVAASTAVAEAPVLEESVAEAVAAAEQETPEEVQPEAADKLDPEQVKQAREDAKALRRDWMRQEVHGVQAAGKPAFIKGTDSFPISDVASLKNEIQAFGRAKDKEAAKKHIISMAKKLGKTDLIPDGWNAS